jgi:hypothetical protein
MASDGTDYFVVLERYGAGIYGARVSAAGAVLDAPVPITTGYMTTPAVAFNGTQYLVAWAANASDIRAARVSTTASVLDAAGFTVSARTETELNPSVASNGNGWLVGWNTETCTTTCNPSCYGVCVGDVRAARVAANGGVSDGLGIGVSTAANMQSRPTLAWDGTTYWAVWQDERSQAGNSDLYAARIQSTGTVTDTSGLGVSFEPEDERFPALAAGSGGRLLVVYQRYDATPPHGAVRARARFLIGEAGVGEPCTVAGDCAAGSCVDADPHRDRSGRRMRSGGHDHVRHHGSLRWYRRLRALRVRHAVRHADLLGHPGQRSRV